MKKIHPNDIESKHIDTETNTTRNCEYMCYYLRRDSNILVFSCAIPCVCLISIISIAVLFSYLKARF